jgi:hypothetical protein
MPALPSVPPIDYETYATRVLRTAPSVAMVPEEAAAADAASAAASAAADAAPPAIPPPASAHPLPLGARVLARFRGGKKA